jgi:hypothetical protein
MAARPGYNALVKTTLALTAFPGGCGRSVVIGNFAGPATIARMTADASGSRDPQKSGYLNPVFRSIDPHYPGLSIAELTCLVCVSRNCTIFSGEGFGLNIPDSVRTQRCKLSTTPRIRSAVARRAFTVAMAAAFSSGRCRRASETWISQEPSLPSSSARNCSRASLGGRIGWPFNSLSVAAQARGGLAKSATAAANRSGCETRSLKDSRRRKVIFSSTCHKRRLAGAVCPGTQVTAAAPPLITPAA